MRQLAALFRTFGHTAWSIWPFSRDDSDDGQLSHWLRFFCWRQARGSWRSANRYLPDDLMDRAIWPYGAFTCAPDGQRPYGCDCAPSS